MISPLFGSSLQGRDLSLLSSCGIERDIVERALWRRVSSEQGAQLVGRTDFSDYSGIAIPYIWPGESHVREYRLRRDHPELEYQADGTTRLRNKYLSPPARPNLLYLPPDIPPGYLVDSETPIFVTEGEKKALALHGLARISPQAAESAFRWLSMGLAGVWSWRTSVGKGLGPDGSRLKVKGPLPDLDRIVWANREATIIFDSNVSTNGNVFRARRALAKELSRRGARVRFVEIPVLEGVNGIDDLIGMWGSDRTRKWLETNAYDDDDRGRANPNSPCVCIEKIPSVHDFAPKQITFVVEGLIAEGALHLITGESGHGKSTFATALAASIATGRDFAGRTCQRRKVLILDRENPGAVVADRLNRLRVDDGTDLKIWGGWMPSEAPDPGSRTIFEWAAATDPKPVLVIDSLIAFLDGDENSSNEVRRFMHRIRRLTNLGVAVILLHHIGKGENSSKYRGSSDIKAAIDIGIRLRNVQACGLGKIEVQAFKTRFSILPDFEVMYSDGVFTNCSEPQLREVPLSAGYDLILRELLGAHPGVKQDRFGKLASEVGVPRDVSRLFLKKGGDQGSIRIVNGPRNALLYSLSNANPPELAASSTP